jgi:hypothetical protein
MQDKVGQTHVGSPIEPIRRISGPETFDCEG